MDTSPVSEHTFEHKVPPVSPTEIWVTEQHTQILSPDSCSETHYEGVSSKLYNWSGGREAQKAQGRIECSRKTTCQGLWESQRSNTPLRARIFQPAAERAHSSDSRWGKKCFIVCLMNLLIMNSIPWLPVDRDSGAARRRLSASQGYGLSFISLLSVRLISRDNKGANPPWQQEIIWTTETHLCVDCFPRLRHQHRNQGSEVPQEQIGVPEPTCGGLVKDLFVFHLRTELEMKTFTLVSPSLWLDGLKCVTA